VPKPTVQLDLAALLQKSNPQEAITLYQQVKKDHPDTPIADEADKGLARVSPAS